MSDKKILFVDDDNHILTGFRRQLEDKFEIETAESGKLGLELAEKEKFAVVVSDYKMPEMNGVEFLMKFREKYPDTIRIMLTGQADLQSVIDIINEGSIFRFLTKPCTDEQLIKNINDALTQYNLARTEKDLLSKTMTGAIQAICDMLLLSKPLLFNKSIKIRKIIKEMLILTKPERSWEIEIAALLSQIGCVTIPDYITERIFKNIPVPDEERDQYEKCSGKGSEIISKIPRMEKVAEIIINQNKCYNGNGYPDNGLKFEMIPYGSRMLKIALDYDQLATIKNSKQEIIKIMKNKNGIYDDRLLDLLDAINL